MKVLSGPYTGDPNYAGFLKFPFELDTFQKHAVCSIDSLRNVLVTAFTGSGKTLVAEYATMCSLQRGKRVIYTSPIKSLSNQKFYEFKQKFSDASVGIFTGDIKFNPFSNVTIMTTEILRNMLYKRRELDPQSPREGEVTFDLENEVDTVIFDEIHYINDKDRGKVWEECIIMLPKNIQIIMLSATIDRAEEFAEWVHKVRERPIDLIPTFKRYVPLKHSFYLHGASKNGETPLDEISHALIPLLDSDGKFQIMNYEKLVRVKRDYDKYVGKRNYGQTGMLNPLVTFLTERNLCPALFFVFSRKKCEEYAKAVTRTLLTSQEQAQVEKIITQQLLKIRDHEKYSNLPQFLMLKQMLLKGVSVHHSGLIPIFKELIELLFAQKLVKVLFATETFAVGVNMPTKTVLYTELSKRDNNGYRLLMTNEFTQMSGRAGRRGIDTVGHVILLPNLFQELPTSVEMERMMLGKSQHIQSKFTIDYLFVLKSTNGQIAHASLLNQELQRQIKGIQARIAELSEPPPVDEEPFQEYEELVKELVATSNNFKLSRKAEKQRADKIATMESHPAFPQYKAYMEWKQSYTALQDELFYNETFIEYYMQKVSQILLDNGYMDADDLTLKGIIASHVSECNPILLTEMLVTGMFDNLSGPEIAAVLSIFLSDQSADDPIHLSSLDVPKNVKQVIESLQPICEQYLDLESRHELYLNSNWELSLSMVESAYCWARQIAQPEQLLFEGDFVKAMLKLVSLCQTLATISELVKKHDLISRLKELEIIIMRDIVSVESLYIL